MSAPDETPVLSNAMAIEAQAALWVQRRQFWDWSASDQAELDAWLLQSTAHEVAFIRLMAGYSRTDRLVALRAPRVDRRLMGRLARVAAGLALAAAFGTWAMRTAEPVQTTYTTPVGGRQTVMLADGSRIDLNTNSILRLSGDRAHRIAFLDKGEAYFQIKHDALHPFTVMVSDHRITDLGTKFLVRTSSNRLDVTLVEGRARVDSRDNPRSVDLEPGDEVVATTGKITTIRKTVEDVRDQLGWRRGVIVFKHTTLTDAAAEFNRYNPNRIIVGSGAVAALKIDGTFPSDDPDAFVEITRDILHLRAERRGSDVVLTK